MAAASDAVITCSIEPSITTREPWMAAPRWSTRNVSDDVSASLLRINCSHASEFLKPAVQAASNATEAMTQAMERIRIFIDVPFFRPSGIVAYGVAIGRRIGYPHNGRRRLRPRTRFAERARLAVPTFRT